MTTNQTAPSFSPYGHVLKPGASQRNEIEMVAPTGFEPVFES